MTLIKVVSIFLPFSALLILVADVTAALQPSSSLTVSPWGGWRIALDIGRDETIFTTMPKSWGSTGARFPLVMKCNFTDSGSSNGNGNVTPIAGNVRYTVAEGEVVKPVNDGTWSLSDDNRDLSFTLTFPERMERNGVELDSMSTIRCEGLMYTWNDLKALDEDFYKVRSITDGINAQVKESKRRREAPKKWNFDTNQWETRYPNESSLALFGKRMKQFYAGFVEETQSAKRPNTLDLSLECGPFPGIDCDVYIKKRGIIKLDGAGTGGVIGTWSAEPMNDNPASYYRPTY